MKFSLATPLISRDGSLSRDAKLLNCYWESTIDGDKMIVRRPTLGAEFAYPAGQGQGAFLSTDICYGIIGDKVYGLGNASTFTPVPIPGVSAPGRRMTVLQGTLLSSGVDFTIFKSAYVSATSPLASQAWKWTQGAITQITTMPLSVAGMVYLDGTYYVLSPEGAVYGSALEDPTTWPALNFISTDRGLGRAVSINRHLNYVTAFCEKGIQFFYDAANPAPGTPLSPVANATTTIGCAHADSIQEIDDTMVFMSVDASGGRSIKMIRGLSVMQLSDSNVDRILAANKVVNSYAEMYSLLVKMNGHTFYVLTIGNLTLACDMDLQSWSQWSSFDTAQAANFGGEGAFDPGFSLRSGSIDNATFFISRKLGKTYSLRPGVVGTEQVRMMARTKAFNSDSSSRKRISELNLFADTVGETISCRYSNNDGLVWSADRSINLSLPLKRLTRLGSFYNRSFEFNYIGASPLQITSVQIPDRNAPAQVSPSSE